LVEDADDVLPETGNKLSETPCFFSGLDGKIAGFKKDLVAYVVEGAVLLVVESTGIAGVFYGY